MKKKYSLKFVTWPTSGEDVMIYIRLIVDRKKTEFTTGIRGLESDWDYQRQRFTERTNYNKNLNYQITCAADRIRDTYDGMVSRGIKPTSIKVRNEFRGEKDVRYQPELLDYIEAHIKKMRLMLDESYKPGTIQHYDALYKRLLKFLVSINERRILLKNFKRGHIVEFKEYLLTTDHEALNRPMKLATCNKYLSKLKAVMNDAIKKDILLTNPFEGVKMKRVKGTREFLTEDELRAIENVDLNNDSLHRVKLIFLFSAYTGLRYSDAINMKRHQIVRDSTGRYRMYISQKKTSERMDRPMLQQAVDLFLQLKEMNPNDEYVLPRISNQKLNAYLKVIAGIIGLRKPLTHHVARHTFATLMLESGVDIKMVSHFLGHKSIKTTEQIYAKVTKKLENNVIDLFGESLDNRQERPLVPPVMPSFSLN